MANIIIKADKRTEFGKGFARRARVAGLVPAVIYGASQEPVHVTLNAHEVLMALKRQNAIFEIELGSKKHNAIAKDVQRHPYKPILEHVDFLAIAAGTKIKIDVELRVVGSAAPNSLLTQETHQLSVLADPTKLPEFIEIDIEGKEIGYHLNAGEIKLPAGVELVDKEDTDILSINEQRRAEEPVVAEVEETEEAAEEPVEE